MNRKARFNYETVSEYTAGVILLGSEVKSIRSGDINFGDSFAFAKPDGIWIKNLHISKYKNSSYSDHDEMRERKLLLNKREINKILKLIDTKGMTIVPLEIFLSKGKIKIKIGVCRGKKNWDKKESLKKRDLERESNFKF